MDYYYNQYDNLYSIMSTDKNARDNAIYDAKDQNIPILIPDINFYSSSKDELNLAYNKYLGLPEELKVVSDDIVISNFKMNNDIIYALNMKNMNKDNTKSYDNNHMLYPVIDSLEEGAIFLENKHDKTNIDKAYNKAIVENLIKNNTICICEESMKKFNINSLHDMYIIMSDNDKKYSDKMMYETFGYTNAQYYNFIKSNNTAQTVPQKVNIDFIKKYVSHLISESDESDIREGLINIASKDYNNTGDNIIITNIINDALDKHDIMYNNIIPDTDIKMAEPYPIYSPNDMIDMGIYDTDEIHPDDITYVPEDVDTKWFKDYYNFYNYKIKSESYSINNIARCKLLEKNMNKTNIDERAVLRLGWNPNIPYTSKNKNKANMITEEYLLETSNNFTFRSLIDMNSFNSDILSETSNREMYPVYIILYQGHTPFLSNIVKGVSNSIYSHALLSLDSSMKKMYSFKIDGFVIESLYDKDKSLDDIIKISALFISKEKYDKLLNNLSMFKNNKTSYSIPKLFKFLFNIKSTYTDKNDMSLVCSEFVDRILKLSDIDITNGKPSYFVSPGSLNREMINNNYYIYILYEGMVKNYNADRIDKLTNRLMVNRKTVMIESKNNISTNNMISILKSQKDNIDSLTLVNPDNLNNNLSKVYNRLFDF